MTVHGGVVLNGTTVQSCCRPLIGGDNTTAGRRFTISGGLKPWFKSTLTIVPGKGWLTTVMVNPDTRAYLRFG